MAEPWRALIETLKEPSTPRVSWPVSQVQVVRCLGGPESVGAEPQVEGDRLVLDALKLRSPMTLEELSKATGRNPKTLGDRLSRLRREGRVQLVNMGMWSCRASIDCAQR